jgi:hypothetical protein
LLFIGVFRLAQIIRTEDTVKKTTFAALVLVTSSFFGTPGMFAQNTSSQTAAPGGTFSDAMMDSQLSLMRKDIRSIKKQLVAANLTLTDYEAVKFWPVYEQYSAEYGKITDTRIALIQEYAEEYGTLTNEQADSLIRRWLDTDISADQLRQNYVPLVRKVLSGKKAATFFQLDRRMSMMIDVQITSRLPLVASQE